LKGESLMNGVIWRIVDFLSQFLEPAERDAVRGDLAESGTSALRAFNGILGLVFRRQIAVFSPLWEDWRAWGTLIFVVIPLSILLSIAATEAARGSAVYFWMYLNNWDWALLTNQGFWYTLGNSTLFLCKGFLLLVCWSWSAGILLGAIARGFIRLNARLFVVSLVSCTVFATPAYLDRWTWHVSRPVSSDPNGVVFALEFYRNLLPPLLACALVALPVVSALRSRFTLEDRTVALRFVLYAAALLSLLAMSLREPVVLLILHATWWRSARNFWPVRFLPFASFWPLAYGLIALLSRFSRVKPCSSVS
jgi:hypothetical protein